MSRWFRRFAVALAVAPAVAAVAAPVPAGPTEETVADVKDFLPQRKYLAHPGTVVGVIASDLVKPMGREGRGGPPDAMGFSVDGSSYNWMYTVSTDANPLITNLNVKAGQKGDEALQFPKLDMARPKTVAAFDIKAGYALVELQVNNGKGCPADEAFVATKMTQLDGGKDFPLKVEELVKKAKEKFAADAEKMIDAETWEKARKNALGDKKATGPKETNEVMYVTWLSDKKRLRVTFFRAVTDGDYKLGGGGANIDDGIKNPPPLPVLPPPGAKPGGVPQPAVMRRPPPPRFENNVRWGTQFGVEFGRAYEFDGNGSLVNIRTLKPTLTKNELPPPPMVDRGGPFPLPPPPLPIEKK